MPTSTMTFVNDLVAGSTLLLISCLLPTQEARSWQAGQTPLIALQNLMEAKPPSRDAERMIPQCLYSLKSKRKYS